MIVRELSITQGEKNTKRTTRNPPAKHGWLHFICEHNQVLEKKESWWLFWRYYHDSCKPELLWSKPTTPVHVSRCTCFLLDCATELNHVLNIAMQRCEIDVTEKLATGRLTFCKAPNVPNCPQGYPMAWLGPRISKNVGLTFVVIGPGNVLILTPWQQSHKSQLQVLQIRGPASPSS